MGGNDDEATEAAADGLHRADLPDCGASNRIVTPEIQPTWNINCSKCGAVVVERQRFRPRLVDGPDGAWLPV
jgi:hypothetical protein